MSKHLQTQSIFEQIKQVDTEGNEFWTARILAKVLGYLEFRNFKPVIEKAKEACKNSNQDILDHFVDLHEMIQQLINTKNLAHACAKSQLTQIVIVRKPNNA